MHCDFNVTNYLINVTFGTIEPTLHWRLHPQTQFFQVFFTAEQQQHIFKRLTNLFPRGCAILPGTVDIVR